MIYLDFPDNRGPGRPPKYPVKTLAVGETMFFAGVSSKKIGKCVRKHKPLRFKCRSVVKGGIQGVRVERIA